MRRLVLRMRQFAVLPAAVLAFACAPVAGARSTTTLFVSGFAPAAGPVGRVVTVTGGGLSGATAVSFAGVSASFSVLDDADISATVPVGALTGKVTVTSPAGTATSPTAFKVIPAVNGFSPHWGLPGTQVTILGTALTGASSVSFGGVPASSFTVDSYWQITATVPATGVTGKVKVKTKGGTGSSTTTFDVLVPGSAWAQFRYDDAHSGSNPNETILGPGDVSGLQLDWSKLAGGVVFVSPAVAGGIVYAGSWEDGMFHAYDAASGASLWSVPVGGNGFSSSPAVADGVVYVGSAQGTMYAFDTATGATRWSTSTGDLFGETSPVVADGVVYMGGTGLGHLYAFDASTGSLLWSSATGGAVHGAPAVVNGVVYVARSDNRLYAIGAATGATVWSTAAATYSSSPTVANGVVYVGSSDRRLYAFNATNGASLWNAVTGSHIYSSPAIANGVVYVGSYDDKLYAFNASTGATLWIASTGGTLYSSPAVANGVVYIGSNDKSLYAFDALTGTLLWSTNTGAHVFSSPAVANGIVYVGSGHRLYAYHLAPAAPAAPENGGQRQGLRGGSEAKLIEAG
jgi:outer membrane protein assembly factor BamB